MLIVIILLTAVGLATMTTFQLSRNQYRLVGNIQHLEQAFNQTESVLASAEDWLDTGDNRNATGLSSHSTAEPSLYPIGGLTAAALDPKTMQWGATNSAASGDGRYLIERMAQGITPIGESMSSGEPKDDGAQACRKVDLFRVISKSDSTRAASRIIESNYATTGC